MKKILHLLFIFTLILSCRSNENEDLFEDEKIKKITFLEEEIDNGTTYLHQKLDFNFYYQNNLLTKVYDPNDSYVENLNYENGILKEIKIKKQDHLTIDRQLYYDSNNKLVKVIGINKENSNIKEERFEYPANNVIIIKYFDRFDPNQFILREKRKITFLNQNVNKIEFFRGSETEPVSERKFEYDNKINPNSNVDFNRILATPEMSYAVNVIQDFSQLSKNNVTKVVENKVYGNTEIFYREFNIIYQYNQNNLPTNQSYYLTDPYDTYKIKYSATFQY